MGGLSGIAPSAVFRAGNLNAESAEVSQKTQKDFRKTGLDSSASSA
jgi:hypothetical protein